MSIFGFTPLGSTVLIALFTYALGLLTVIAIDLITERVYSPKRAELKARASQTVDTQMAARALIEREILNGMAIGTANSITNEAAQARYNQGYQNNGGRNTEWF